MVPDMAGGKLHSGVLEALRGEAVMSPIDEFTHLIARLFVACIVAGIFIWRTWK
jgi:hypothetical protein